MGPVALARRRTRWEDKLLSVAYFGQSSLRFLSYESEMQFVRKGWRWRRTRTLRRATSSLASWSVLREDGSDPCHSDNPTDAPEPIFPSFWRPGKERDEGRQGWSSPEPAKAGLSGILSLLSSPNTAQGAPALHGKGSLGNEPTGGELNVEGLGLTPCGEGGNRGIEAVYSTCRRHWKPYRKGF